MECLCSGGVVQLVWGRLCRGSVWKFLLLRMPLLPRVRLCAILRFYFQIKHKLSCVHPCFFRFRGNFRRVPPYSLGDPCAACPDDCEDGLCSKCISVFSCKMILNDDLNATLRRVYCFTDFQFSFLLLANPCPYINTFSICDELKEMATCDHSIVSQWCPASCLCEEKIIPIARKWNLPWPYGMKYSLFV